MPQGSKGSKSFDREVKELIDVMNDSGISVRDGAAARLTGLAGLIMRWNQAMNLISRKDTERLVSYHFADSMSVLPIISPQRRLQILDIGGSNGLPGLVMSAACANIEVLICDSQKKRAGFLEEACALVGSGNEFEIGRVNDREFLGRHADSFDLVVARAVTGLPALLKWCLPVLKPGGSLAAYKGSRCGEEVAAARKYFFGNGGWLLVVMESPLKERYNPLRKFAIALKGN